MHITIYTTPTCPYCKLAKDYFKDKGITFSEIDVAADPAAANEMVKKSGQMGVPVIELGDEIVVGWNESAVEEVLKKSPKKEKQKA
ncbi:MAG: Uxx-star family glutaredoxin-like (seleno)protein [Patescibacteria group bacterium]|nr:Uxx-star family glutaredoxin-like (seleno)protein [Patescibacteria group bacterium]